MAKKKGIDYRHTAESVLELIGGARNVAAFTNCMTRLRLNIKNPSKVDIAALKALPSVQGVVEGDQLQIVFGPGHAQRMKEALEEILHTDKDYDKDTDKDTDNEYYELAEETKRKVKAAQTHPLQKAFKHIGNIFIPIIPAFIACGLFLAVSNICIVAYPAASKNPWFLLIAGVGTLVGGILHIIVGYNASKEFGGTPILGAVAAAFIYSPAINGILATAEAPAQPLTSLLFGVELRPGLGGVLGVILAAFLLSLIEKKIRPIIPAALDLFLVPFITLLLGLTVTIFLIMPISALVMDGITYVLVDLALKQWGVIGGYLLSALFLPLVMLGMHHGLIPIHAQLIANTGYTVLLPILACAGAGQVGMAIAVFVKTKNKNLKELITNALPIGFLGIGEPLIYGVSLPLFTPFITACLGAGFGGAFIGFVNGAVGDVGSTAIGPSGLILLPLIANGMWLWYLLGLLCAYAGGFVLTYFFGYKESAGDKK